MTRVSRPMPISAEFLIIEEPDGTRTYTAFCHICTKSKQANAAWRALYLLAFHYDRRHRGWTDSDGAA
jgi:hypothetical protein